MSRTGRHYWWSWGGWDVMCAQAVGMRNPPLRPSISLERLFHASPSKPFQFVNWEVDSGVARLCSSRGQRSTLNVSRQEQFQQHDACPCPVTHSLLGTFPIPRQYRSASPVTNWILEVSTHCSWISGISCGNLKALDIFKCSHQMNHNINYSAD